MIKFILESILSKGALKASIILSIPTSFIIYFLSNFLEIDNATYLGAIFGIVTTVVAGIFGKLIMDGYEKINTFDKSSFNTIKKREISKLAEEFTQKKYNYISIGKETILLLTVSLGSIITVSVPINFAIHSFSINATLFLNILIKSIPAIFGLLLIYKYSKSRIPIDNFLKYLNEQKAIEEKRAALIKELNRKIHEEQNKDKDKIKQLDLQSFIEKMKEQENHKA